MISHFIDITSVMCASNVNKFFGLLYFFSLMNGIRLLWNWESFINETWQFSQLVLQISFLDSSLGVFRWGFDGIFLIKYSRFLSEKKIKFLTVLKFWNFNGFVKFKFVWKFLEIYKIHKKSVQNLHRMILKTTFMLNENKY